MAAHFPDALKVKVLREEGLVVLSVRVTDWRVDEYTLPLDAFREMTVAFSARPPDWSGPEGLQVKWDARMRRATLAVTVGHNKRDIHKLEGPQFEAMTAQFRAQDV